ncbi:MAG: ribonuclease HII [Clostridia bacterium]|nr:ribonuclease HII [Clostridia bacterium]
MDEIQRLLEMRKYESALIAHGYNIIAGVDEAGRGPLAGDVFAAAVILPEDFLPEGLNDSKKISEKKREKLFDEITKNAISYAVGRASADEIDNINILQATYEAMRRAVKGLRVKPDYVLIDGNPVTDMPFLHASIVKGDSLSLSIAAASIIAKVSRDRYMLEMDSIYPGYGFAVHKGYGTKAHKDAVWELGPCPIHRRSFLKKWYKESDR